MSSVAENLNYYTYNDYKRWNDKLRYELIYGEAYMMGSPSIWHQRIAGSVYRQLGQFLDGEQCEPFIAPVDVRLFPKDNGSDNVVVQPDVFVVCDESKLADGAACAGAPDFAVEVVSSSSRVMDKLTKKDLYCKAGVKEYWVIGQNRVFTYILKDGAYSETIYDLTLSETKEIPVSVLAGCIIKIKAE